MARVRRGRIALFAAVVGLVPALTACLPSTSPGTHVFTWHCVGHDQTWTVPSNVTGSIEFDVYGAQGGTGGGPAASPGGLGGYTHSQVSPTPGGTVLTFRVGCMGKAGDSVTPGMGGAPGYPTWGSGGPYNLAVGLHGGGGGGGESTVTKGTDIFTYYEATAGGGGGGGASKVWTLGVGGDGGRPATAGHAGGTGTTGGGGAGDSDGTRGTGTSGDGGSPSGGGEGAAVCGGGAGGGGPKVGGGGGGDQPCVAGGGGGGGGSYSNDPNATFQTGVQRGDGLIRMTYTTS